MQSAQLDDTVVVRAEDLAPGRVPPVCVKRGVIATDWTRVRFSTTPRWILMLLLFGLFPFVIAWYMTRVVAEGVLPVSAEALRGMRRLRVRTYGFCAAGIALFICAAALQAIGALSGAAAVLGILCLLAAVGWQLVVGPGVTVGATVVRDLDGPIVVLTRVHPGFVDAVRRRRSAE
jgi:hypothetical protein